MSERERRCETCEAWAPVAGSKTGPCQLFPPAPLKAPDSFVFAYPWTEADQWCMQWTSKAAAQASAQGVEAFARVMAGEGERE